MFKIKNIILILLSIVLIFAFVSCDKNPADTNTDTDTENTQSPTDTDIPSYPEKTLRVLRQNENVELYTTYKLGNYFGNGFKKNVSGNVQGIIQYEIMQDYDETSDSTDYGSDVDENLFKSHYILVLRFLYTPDMNGFLGINNLSLEEGKCIANAIYTSKDGLNTEEYYQYFAVPISHLENWNDEGTIELRKEAVDYTYSHKVEVDSYMYKDDGHILLFTRQSLEKYISENNIPIRMGTIGVTPNYLVFFSKGKFDGEINFVYPTFYENKIEITRDFSLSNDVSEKAYLNIIPLNTKVVNDISEVTKIELTLRNIDTGKMMISDYKIAETEVNYSKENLYPTFKGGVFYGLDFNGFEKSAYTVIETFDELNEKTEFIISENEFKNYCVIVLKLVGEKENRIGFSDLIVTENGIEITSHLSPFYERIQSGTNELYDVIDKVHDVPNDKVEYEYILVNKSKLNVIKQKTGNLTIKTDETFNNHNHYIDIGESYESYEKGIYSLSIYPYANRNNYLKSGETFQIKSNLQLCDFVKKYGLDVNLNKISEYNEYIAIYLENHSLDGIMQWSVTEKGKTLQISYLVKELKELTKEENCEKYFVIIEKESTVNYVNASVEYIEMNYQSVKSLPKENEINSYDFYKMQLHKSINWKFKQISDFKTLRSIFNEYGKEEIANGITADDIFLSNVFDENYIIALHLTEGSSGTIKNTFYNARVSGDNALYLYSFENSREGNDAIYNMLYFIIIPKNEIPGYISNVRVENTNEIIYNGPFKYISVTEIGANKIDGTHLIINSETELESFYSDYDNSKKFQNIDFENNFVLALNRKYYKFYPGSFVNFKTTLNGIASITFVHDNSRDFIIDEWYNEQYYDLIIIPKAYLKYEIDYFYVRYTEDSIETMDKIENEEIWDAFEEVTEKLE